jgi:prepilin-type processing-associated H-X9-DG protein
MKRFLAVQVLPASAALACVLMSNQSSTRLAAQTAAAQTVSTNGVVLCQATKLDLSSPEKSVQAFVAALNASRFEEAALCVDGDAPRSVSKEMRQFWSEDKTKISLSALTVETKSEKAVVRALVTFKGGSLREAKLGMASLVPLVRRNERWLLVPVNEQNLPAITKSEDVSLLSYIAGAIHWPAIWIRARESARRSSCASNLKQIALAALMLIQDHDEKIAMTPQNFKAKLFSYAKTMEIFRCPSVKSGESYSFNGNLANRSLSEISNPSQVVMFYEGKNGHLDFRHLGKANVAFVDGHVKTISRSEAKTLKWKP